METIKRIIPKREFKLYNIPENFGEMAEITIRPAKSSGSANDSNSYDSMKLQQESGMAQMLNEPEEEYWNEL